MKKVFKPEDWLPEVEPREMPEQVGHDEPCSQELLDEIELLTAIVEARRVDITGDYHQWLEIGFALKAALGEDGRSFFHRISSIYPGYSEKEADKQYDKCMRSKGEGIGPQTLFYFANQNGIRVRSTQRVESPSRGVEGFEGMREKRMPTFSQDVRRQLPSPLNEIAANAYSDEDADLLILGSIVTLSACLPNLYGVYGDRPVYPNLFLFVTGPASAGKGRLALCRRLVQPIQNRLCGIYTEEMTQYRKAKAEYERQKKKNTLLLPPEVPKRRTLIIPANSSATMLYQILSENDGCGLMFETEGDTLANVFASDYGNYSDGFRKAFHHEPISYTRRKDREFVELMQPKLSTVLSGTPRQIATLIPDTENGLFSRFIFYCMDFQLEWLNVFQQHKDGENLEATFDRMGGRMMGQYERLQKSKRIRFSLTAPQKKQFNDYFRKTQLDCYRDFGDDIIASVRRLGLITFRIAMILSMLRKADAANYPTTLYCQDEDFRSTMAIARVLIRHTSHVYKELSSHELYRPAAERSDRQRQLLEALPDAFGTAEAIEAAGKLGISQKSVERYLTDWRKQDLIQRISHGHYSKCAASIDQPQPIKHQQQ